MSKLKKIPTNEREETPIVKLSDREEAQKKLEELNKIDVANCQKEVNEAIANICEKYGCRALIQGQFIGAEIKTGLLIVKAK